MDVEMARAMGNIEGRLGAVEARVAHNEVTTAAALARLEKKMDDLIEQITGSNARAAYREGNTRGAKAMAIFIVTVAASLGGILLELGKITWTALTGQHH